jgi:uncharacterized protein (TIGR03118 family)
VSPFLQRFYEMLCPLRHLVSRRLIFWREKMRALITYPLMLLFASGNSLFAGPFTQTNLVSNVSGMAAVTDPNLVDPWGMSFSATSPIWVSDRATGVSTLYSGTGSIVPLVVAVPPGGPNGPTGQVFAGGTSFTVNGSAASFIFATLGGTIDAWNGGTTATVEHTTAGATFEGLALANNTLYAANFQSGGGIDAFDSSYASIATSGGFSDPNLPAGYAPFNIQNIGGKLYVEYAKVTAGVPVPLPGGGGYVDVYDTNGNLLQRLVANGPLDAPWGIALAPASFGSFGGDLLIGNFGNGQINAFNPTTGAFIGTLDDSSGNPIVNSGLWAIEFGNNSANPNALYFDAGINMGTGGLFGEIQASPEPGSLGLAGLGVFLVLGYAWLRRSKATRPIS